MRNVLVADDHAVVRRGLRELLHEGFGGVNVFEAWDGESVLEQLDARPWDLIMLDVMMPGTNVIDVVRRIRSTIASVPVLVVTAVTETEWVVQTLKAGANGLVYKHRAPDELVHAIRTVAGGGTYLHAETAAAIAKCVREERPLPHRKLSERELEVFRLIALGREIKEIGGDLDISDKTVATYLSRIREKTGLTSHVEIARYALHHGIVE